MNLRSLLPGLLLAVIIATVSIILSGFSKSLSSATLSLIFGLIAGNLLPSRPLLRYSPGMAFGEKYFLETAIVLIGFGINFKVLGDLGTGYLLLIIVSVILVFLAALLTGYLSGTSKNTAILIGAGSAICGSAAIGAVSSVIKSSKEETGLSIGIINLLGAIGMLALPILASLLSFSVDETALMIGGILQSMGHVVGAAFSVGDETGTIATIIKMARVVLLVPLIGILFMLKKKEPSSKVMAGFPWFIPLFFGAIVLGQFIHPPQPAKDGIASVADFLLVTAMAGIGFKIRISPLLKIAGSGLLAGALVFLFQILIFVFYLKS